MEVFVANEQQIPIDEGRFAALARHALDEEDIAEGAELSVLLVDADHIRRLNSRFAGDDHATDVLAFPMLEDNNDSTELLGDVVICPEIAQGNAQRLGHPIERELEVLLVHGTLHLLGYDHQKDEDKAKMETRVTEILGSFSPPQS